MSRRLPSRPDCCRFVKQARLSVHSKLADWDDDDPQALQETSSRWDKVVILKHMFTLQEIEVRSLLFASILWP